MSRKLGRRLTFLVGKPGLDGHSNGAEQIAVRARDAGMQVVYEGIRLTPEEIVDAARKQKAHVIGLSVLSGSHLPLVEDVVARMKEAGLTGAGGGRRHHSAGGRRGAGKIRRRRGLHAEGFRVEPHHVGRGADRGAGERREQRLAAARAFTHLARRHVIAALESPVETGQVAKSDLEGDRGDAAVGKAHIAQHHVNDSEALLQHKIGK